ncbi:hypothetical protein ACFLTA_02090 [Bacteroidota bacterium]
MKKIFLLITVFLIPVSLLCQVDKMYEDLTRPSIERKLTVYGGHLQLDAGYQFASGNKQFDGSGNKIGVIEASPTALSNSFRFGLKYGILDYIQFDANMWYHNSIVSDPSVVLLNFTTFNYVDRLEQAKGMGDLYMGLILRLPFEISWFDWSVQAGTRLPTAKYEPDQPGHTYKIYDQTSGAYQVSYKDYPRQGKGVAHSRLGTSLNLSTGKLGFWLNYLYHPVSKEVETNQWRHRLVNDKFEYMKETYLLKHPSETYLDLTIGYQAFPWFIAYATYFYEFSAGGWTESTGQRIAFPNANLSVFSLNFEIQVSTHLRFQQYINFPLAGKNTWSSFSFHTGISYSIVPLQNMYY